MVIRKMDVQITVIMMLVAFPLITSTPVSLSGTAMSAQDLIESIPKEDRGAFVAFHLSNALNSLQGIPRYTIRLPKEAKIPHDKYEKFKGITTAPQFSSHLLHWTRTTFNITNSDVYALVTKFSTVCFPGGCFDANDVGALCCPF